jgi:uncharacterized membrane protein YwzB
MAFRQQTQNEWAMMITMSAPGWPTSLRPANERDDRSHYVVIVVVVVVIVVVFVIIDAIQIATLLIKKRANYARMMNDIRSLHVCSLASRSERTQSKYRRNSVKQQIELDKKRNAHTIKYNTDRLSFAFLTINAM